MPFGDYFGGGFGGGYSWSAPSYDFSYTAPSYSWSAPSYDYSSPPSYTPSYDFTTPSWQGSNINTGITNTPEYLSMGTTDPLTAYISTPINMGDPYNLISSGPDYNANTQAQLGAIDYVLTNPAAADAYLNNTGAAPDYSLTSNATTTPDYSYDVGAANPNIGSLTTETTDTGALPTDTGGGATTPTSDATSSGGGALPVDTGNVSDTGGGPFSSGAPTLSDIVTNSRDPVATQEAFSGAYDSATNAGYVAAAYADSGMSPEQVAQLLVDQYGIDPAAARIAADSAAYGAEPDAIASILNGSFGPVPSLNIGDIPAQEMQISPQNMAEYQANLQDIYDRGGYTSQWQTVGSDRVMVQDDGTAIGINTETGQQYALDKGTVDQMVRQGLLNTRESGYVAATGGTGNRPGGSPPAKAAAQVGKGGGGGGGKSQMTQNVKKSFTTNIAGQQGAAGAAPVKPGFVGATSLSSQAPSASDMASLFPQLKQLQSSIATQLQNSSPDLVRLLLSRTPGYFSYGGGGNLPILGMKKGGHVDKGALPVFRTGGQGKHVQGPGDGQSDDIPAMLADGEYVFDADTVAALGNGSNRAGAEALDKMREKIREHKRSAPNNKIPPQAKSPLSYLAQGE